VFLKIKQMKKYVITGALGHISKPIVTELVKAGNRVTVITSNSERAAEIEALGAVAAVGSVSDAVFLKETFKDADAAYLMIPPNFAAPHFLTYAKEVADNYIAALKESSIKHVVELSSIGAHLRNGAGPIDGLAYLEEQLGKLDDVNVVMLRPGYFYYNFYTMLGMIQHANIMGSNFGGGEEKMVLSHHLDIAAKAAELLRDLNFTGHGVAYIVSDVRHGSDVAGVVGKAVGKADLLWVQFADEDARKAMTDNGLSADMAENYVAMGKAFREGGAQEHFYQGGVVVAGKRKLEEFMEEFVGVYKAG
jgi:uncharacterized protein YbjT (DUF2867 family)